jgi:predicted house-cleaning noncanonical NTP pyrophosphatase (MazG superfamily)
VRRIENRADLRAFTENDTAFDLGNRRVVFRPGNPDLIRARDFVAEIGNVAKSKGWRVVLEGSALAHNWYLLRAAGVDVESSAEYVNKPRRRRTFEKLVRDKIPKAIEAKGERVSSVELSASELRGALQRKMVEEAFEVLAAIGDEELLSELADVYEVVSALARQAGGTLDGVRQRADKKRASKGGFERGYFLVSTGGESIDEKQQRRKYATVVPTSAGFRLALPLVPPAGGASTETTMVQVLGARLRLKFEYRGSQVIVEVDPLEAVVEERQLRLFQ